MADVRNPFEIPAIWNSSNELTKTIACKFWQRQADVLDQMQNFASGWFDRRHVGTKAAFDAAQKCCAASTPVDFFTSYQEWAAGAMSRVLEDELAYQKLAASVISSTIPSTQLEKTAAEAPSVFQGAWAA